MLNRGSIFLCGFIAQNASAALIVRSAAVPFCAVTVFSFIPTDVFSNIKF